MTRVCTTILLTTRLLILVMTQLLILLMTRLPILLILVMTRARMSGHTMTPHTTLLLTRLCTARRLLTR
ncbi:hypothetical protein ATCV1_z631R [Acanthocystis turfacea chlorella virus 1]|uniref:Uncharacterized protein z631R n=1 Tax=Chlorovirus heliozoae TaxID=322019 RepID=A7K9P1_9PHYC|nr:hypothetical protein ATCV1_z631R [Acanthocystis turfacea chlorella virus 1]ABT16765.1 hypothetical protein ATCV1_z631R [Acanthocystis turfacea chlorella virus 1]